ncbi:MAG: hypothetical protein GEEBNDBF_01869 [bacterium]|nr:hypothetical protein [bacterium]
MRPSRPGLTSFAYQCCMEPQDELPGWLMRSLVALALILILMLPMLTTQLQDMRGAVQRSAHELRADGQLPPYMMAQPPGAEVVRTP